MTDAEQSVKKTIERLAFIQGLVDENGNKIDPKNRNKKGQKHGSGHKGPREIVTPAKDENVLSDVAALVGGEVSQSEDNTKTQSMPKIDEDAVTENEKSEVPSNAKESESEIIHEAAHTDHPSSDVQDNNSEDKEEQTQESISTPGLHAEEALHIEPPKEDMKSQQNVPETSTATETPPRAKSNRFKEAREGMSEQIGIKITAEEAAIIERERPRATIIKSIKYVDSKTGKDIAPPDYLNENSPETLDRRKRSSLASLIDLETGEIIDITKRYFYIGSEQGKDLVIEKRYVSRNHACIIDRDDTYYIMDSGSTNGTFVNGRRVLEGEEAYIKSGDTIKFANHSYIFEC